MSDTPQGFPFRIDAAIADGLSFSVSGFLPSDAKVEDMDKQVDTLLSVVERQRAKTQIDQWKADLDAKKRVLAQEQERLAKQHEERSKSDTDFTKQAVAATQQNVERLKREIVGGEASIAGLTPKLRANGAAAAG